MSNDICVVLYYRPHAASETFRRHGRGLPPAPSCVEANINESLTVCMVYSLGERIAVE